MGNKHLIIPLKIDIRDFEFDTEEIIKLGWVNSVSTGVTMRSFDKPKKKDIKSHHEICLRDIY